MKFLITFILLLSLFVAGGCTRIETGEVGVRINASKQVEGTELPAGGFYQTFVGSILTFPVKDIVVAIDNKTPMTSDNSPLQDFDITVVYAINPSAAAELYSTKSKSFHIEYKGDIYLMQNYMTTIVNNAAYKVVREYKSLEAADNRKEMEDKILAVVSDTLKAEKLDTSMTVTVVQIRNILPNADILRSATAYVKAQNELKIKQTEVEIAKKESERMAALSSNAGQSIAYMNAQSQMMIAQGIRDGKVNTIVVPTDFKGIINAK